MSDPTTKSIASKRSTRSITHIGKESTQKTLRMQQQQIEALKKENDDLRKKYDFETRIPPSSKPKGVHFKELQDLQQQGKTLDEKKVAIQAENESLKNDINELTRAVNEKRKEVKGVYSTKDSDTALSLQLRTLENRLDQALLRYNEAITGNKRLREEIDSMRCERVVFDGVHRKMEKSLFEKKQEMASIIEEANICYEERTTCDQEKKLISEKEKELRINFEKESKYLDEEINKLDQLNDLLKSSQFKNSPSSLDYSLEEENDSRGMDHGIDRNTPSELSNFSQSHSTPPPQSSPPAPPTSLSYLTTLTEGLWRITNATGMTSIDDILNQYSETEDVIVTNNDIIGEIEIQIQRLEKEEREDRERVRKLLEDAENKGNEREKERIDLEKQIKATTDRTKAYSKKTEEVSESFSKIYPLVSSLFSLAECELPDEANAEGTVTQSNVVSYLGKIEQRVNDLKATYLTLYPTLLSSLNKSRMAGSGSKYRSYLPSLSSSPSPSSSPSSSLEMSNEGDYGNGREEEEGGRGEEEN